MKAEHIHRLSVEGEREAATAKALPICRRSKAPRQALVLGILLNLMAMGLTACSSTRRPPIEPIMAQPTATRPIWLDEPLSWGKLNGLETWLKSGESARSSVDPAVVREAQLQLNEGRLELAEQDLKHEDAPTRSISLRLEAARGGFEELLAQGSLAPAQRARAEVGRRKSMALVTTSPPSGLRILPRRNWQAAPPRPSNLTAARGKWNRLTVHHSAHYSTGSSSADQGGSVSDSARTIRAIQDDHMNRRSPRFGDVGYHFLIDAAGRIFQGRELNWQGAHVLGQNHMNIGVCLLGNFEAARPSSAALKSLELLLDELRSKHAILPSHIKPHSHLGNTACPGDTIERWLRAYSQTKR